MTATISSPQGRRSKTNKSKKRAKKTKKKTETKPTKKIKTKAKKTEPTPTRKIKKPPSKIVAGQTFEAEKRHHEAEEENEQDGRHDHVAGGKPFKVNFCHVFKTNNKISNSARLTQTAKRLGIEEVEKMTRQREFQKAEAVEKDRRIHKLKKANSPKPRSGKLWPEEYCEEKRPVFSGTDRREVPCKVKIETPVLSATEDLKVYDTTKGLYMEGAFTLIPRKDVLRGFSNEDGLQKEYDAMEFLEQENKNSTGTIRSKKRTVYKESRDGSRYLNVGVACDHTKDAGVSQHLHGLDKHEQHHEVIGEYIQSVEEQSAAWLHQENLVFLQAAKQAAKYPGFDCRNGKESEMFSTMACGRNVFLNVHTDQDFFWSVTTLIQKDAGPLTMDSPVCNYFCFPTLGVCVALRHGDILLFNPLVFHCISARCDDTMDEFCISLYLKTAVVSGYDNGEYRGMKRRKDKPTPISDTETAQSDGNTTLSGSCSESCASMLDATNLLQYY